MAQDAPDLELSETRFCLVNSALDLPAGSGKSIPAGSPCSSYQSASEIVDSYWPVDAKIVGTLTSDATVTWTQSGTARVTLNGDPQSFSPDGGAQMMQVRSIPGSAGTVTLSATVTGADFPVPITKTVTITVVDHGVGLKVTRAHGSWHLDSAGTETRSFRVRLKAVPAGTVTVTFTKHSRTSGNINLSVNSLTFTTTNWNVYQTVNVTGAGAGVAYLQIRSSGGEYSYVDSKWLRYEIYQTDATVSHAALRMAESSLTMDDQGVFRRQFLMRLNKRPSGTVTVSMTQTSTDGGSVRIEDTGGTEVASTTFTRRNWSAVQKFHVYGESAGNVTITLDPSGGGFDGAASKTVSATVTTPALVSGAALVVNRTAATVNDSGTESVRFRVKLAKRPSATMRVGISVSSSDGGEVALSQTSDLWFRTYDWNRWKDIRVRGRTPGTVKITLDPYGGGYRNAASQEVTVTVTAASVGSMAGAVVNEVIDGMAGSLMEGAGFVFSERFEGIGDGMDVRLAGHALTGAKGLPSEYCTTCLEVREIGDDALLGGSSFALPLSFGQRRQGTVWGRGNVSHFDGNGVQRSGWLGMDLAISADSTVGFALSRSFGESEWSLEDQSGNAESELESLWAYSEVGLPGGGAARAVYGMGSGTLQLDALDVTQTPLEMTMAVAGVNRPLFEVETWSVSLVGDAAAVHLRTLGSGPTGGQETRVWRTGWGLAMSRSGNGPVMTSGSVLARHGGDGEATGSDLSFDGRLRVTPAGSALSLDARLRWAALRNGIRVEDGGELWQRSGALRTVGSSSFTARVTWDFSSVKEGFRPFVEFGAGSPAQQRYAAGVEVTGAGFRARLGGEHRERDSDETRFGLDLNIRF